MPKSSTPRTSHLPKPPHGSPRMSRAEISFVGHGHVNNSADRGLSGRWPLHRPGLGVADRRAEGGTYPLAQAALIHELPRVLGEFQVGSGCGLIEVVQGLVGVDVETRHDDV